LDGRPVIGFKMNPRIDAGQLSPVKDHAPISHTFDCQDNRDRELRLEGNLFGGDSSWQEFAGAHHGGECDGRLSGALHLAPLCGDDTR
jgi:hypothetical protein